MNRASRLEATVSHLADTIGARPPGSAAERQAADFLLAEFRALLLETSLECFDTPSHLADRATLTLDSGEDIPCLPCQFSPAGDVHGPLVFLGRDGIPRNNGSVRGALGVFLPGGSIPSSIALLQRLATEGLAGLLVISPYMDGILTKAVRFPEIEHLPVAAVSWRMGEKLVGLAGTGASLCVTHVLEERHESQNVVATLPGSGPNWLAISAHHDTAPYAPGALDNGSGCAVLLELARELRDAMLPATLRFIATGCEEYGRKDGVGAGAQAYWDAHADDLGTCLGWVEIDDVGNRLGDLHVFIGGRKPFADAIRSVSPPPHTCFPGKPSTGCDHGAAEQRGLPTVWFNDSADAPRPHYHSPADTMEFLDAAKAASYVPHIAAVVEALTRIDLPNPIVREGDLLLRQATFADLEPIREITRLAFEPVSFDRMKEEFFQERLGGRDWHEYKCGGLISSLRGRIYQVVVTEVGGCVVGYATYLLDPTRGIATIGNNAVHPESQRRGIGKLQQREVERRMREAGYTKFQVSTLSNDTPAQHVYEKLGYQRVVETIHYLRRDD
ncbi:MAG: GNAT family N-acetyltransferase [Lentisphaeria bacterium]|nr:GNAT family N-acetyltransferase [Lentisphaeria bacterium]